MELGPSKYAKNVSTDPTKIFHYRQAHSENFYKFENFDQLVYFNNRQLPNHKSGIDLECDFVSNFRDPSRKMPLEK